MITIIGSKDIAELIAKSSSMSDLDSALERVCRDQVNSSEIWDALASLQHFKRSEVFTSVFLGSKTIRLGKINKSNIRKILVASYLNDESSWMVHRVVEKYYSSFTYAEVIDIFLSASPSSFINFFLKFKFQNSSCKLASVVKRLEDEISNIDFSDITNLILTPRVQAITTVIMLVAPEKHPELLNLALNYSFTGNQNYFSSSSNDDVRIREFTIDKFNFLRYAYLQHLIKNNRTEEIKNIFFKQSSVLRCKANIQKVCKVWDQFNIRSSELRFKIMDQFINPVENSPITSHIKAKKLFELFKSDFYYDPIYQNMDLYAYTSLLHQYIKQEDHSMVSELFNIFKSKYFETDTPKSANQEDLIRQSNTKAILEYLAKHKIEIK